MDLTNDVCASHSLSQLMTHQYCCHFSSSKTSSGIGSINTRSDTCLKRQWKDHTEDVSRVQMRPTHQARNKQHLSSEMNVFRAAAGTIISVLGRYRPDGSEFMDLKAAHQSRWNVKSVRWREGGGVGGVCVEKSVPGCSDGSFGHYRYECLGDKPC